MTLIQKRLRMSTGVPLRHRVRPLGAAPPLVPTSFANLIGGACVAKKLPLFLEPHTGSPAPASCGSSDWTGWHEWSEWKKWEAKFFPSRFCISLEEREIDLRIFFLRLGPEMMGSWRSNEC